MSIEVAAEPLASPEVAGLLRALDDHLDGLYPPEDNFGDLAPAEVEPPRGVFVVARRDGVAVGCGGLRRLPGATAELKRMFVAHSARRRGVGRAVLAHLEGWARSSGVDGIVVEVGALQVDAVGLYEAAGFVPIPCFGVYATAPNSRCYRKELGAGI